jgi:glucokinase
MLLPLKYTSWDLGRVNGLTILAGDIGATKTNLALYRVVNRQLMEISKMKFISQQFPEPGMMVKEVLKGWSKPDRVCIGVPGPVINGKTKLTNLNWEIDEQLLSKEIGLNNLCLVNDLEAMAYGLALLPETDCVVVQKGISGQAGNAAIIAPGTGLGEAGLYYDGSVYHPFATEGGHCDFAPRTKLDIELLNHLQEQFGHVSWERLICGPGIFNIYKFFRDVISINEPAWLNGLLEKGDYPAVISSNINASELCYKTMEYFIRYLAYESSNLALKFKAIGGLFIGGGIAPQILELFKVFRFDNSFCQSGRLNYLLENVPVKVIKNTEAPLLGAAYFGIHQQL